MRGARTFALALLLAPGAVAAQRPTTPPAPGPVRPAAFPPFQEAVLPNGMRLVLVEDRRQPVVSVSLAFPAGNVYDPAGKEGVADLTATLLTKGAGNRTADQIAAAIEGVGGSLNAGAGADFLTVYTTVLTPNVPLAFELLGDVVRRPTFPQSEVDLAKTQALSGLQLELSQPGAIASRVFARELYGRHPYARRTSSNALRAIERADLVAFQRSRLRPAGALLVIAGDMNLAEARRAAVTAFGSWTGSAPAPIVFPAPPARTKPEIVLVHRPGSVQSNILVGNTTFSPSDPRYYPSVVANRVLGGGAASRLFTILREQKSWTYGSFSGYSRPRGIGAFQASAEVRNEVTDSALVELLSQVRRMGSEAVPAAELEAAKNALVGSFPLTIQTPGQVASSVANAKLLGLPSDYLSTYRLRLAAVTATQLQGAARATMRPEQALIVVVGDAAQIHDKLKKIATVRVVDVEGNPMSAADLAPATAGALDLDFARLVPRTDSFTVMVQGQPFGFMRSTLEKTATGWKLTEETRIGSLLSQHTETTFGADAAPAAVKQSGKVQGQDTKIDVTYAGGRARGSAATPGPTGITPVTIDTVVPAGVIDENMMAALLPAMRWSPTAKFTLNIFSSGRGRLTPTTLAVKGTESMTVPAGTFDVYRVEVSGSEQPVTLFVTTAPPHRLVKLAPAGAPVELVLAK